MALDMAWTSSEPVSEDDSLWDSRVESSTCIELSSIGSSVLSAAPYSTGRAGTIKPTHLTVSLYGCLMKGPSPWPWKWRGGVAVAVAVASAGLAKKS